jgi:hypothetical protein
MVRHASETKTTLGMPEYFVRSIAARKSIASAAATGAPLGSQWSLRPCQ